MGTGYESNAYTGFAFVYDLFMDNIPYDMWCGYIKKLLEKYDVYSGIIAELGCGTGNMTRRLYEYGYDMIGIDNSEDMLAVAREKWMESSSMKDITENAVDGKIPQSSILYLQQDMRKLELYGTVAGVVSVCDCMNYLLEERDLLQTFQLVNNYLDPGGIFIFDLKTEYYFENLAENTIAENRPEASFIWENYYDKKTGINQYDLTVYASEEMLERTNAEEFLSENDCDESNRKEDMMVENSMDQGDLEEAESELDYFEEPAVFLRFDETHYQRAYSLEVIKKLLKQSGMEFVAAYDAFTEDAPRRESERIYVIAREGHQENKLYT